MRSASLLPRSSRSFSSIFPNVRAFAFVALIFFSSVIARTVRNGESSSAQKTFSPSAPPGNAARPHGDGASGERGQGALRIAGAAHAHRDAVVATDGLGALPVRAARAHAKAAVRDHAP
jgi:hypothetical protein